MDELRTFVFKWGRRLVTGALLIATTVLGVRALDARSLPGLEIWHRAVLDAEFTQAAGEGILGLEDYLQLEHALFEQLDERVATTVTAAAGSRLNRYLAGSRSDPRQFEQNWNRTFEMRLDEILGGVLLIHGLTDSPYSVRHLADMLVAQGYYVLGMRMPGHGTIPGALLRARWQDWAAAVAIGARHVVTQIPTDAPFLLGGYSNGGHWP